MPRCLKISALIGLAAALAQFGTAARAETYADTEHTTTEIIAEREGFSPGETTWFAVRQDVREGWHVFWANPGSAGIPLALQWRLPDGFDVGALKRPVPQYIPVGPLASYAHEGEPIVLVPVTAPGHAKVGEEIKIEINAEWQVCEVVCIPEEARFSFSLPVLDKAEKSVDRRALFERARAALPEVFAGAATFSAKGADYELEVEGWPDKRARDVFFFPEVEGLTEPAGEQRASVRNGVLNVSMESGWTKDVAGDIVKGVIAYKNAQGARVGVEIGAALEGALESSLAKLAAPAGGASFGVLLALAFFGGLILNAMPCVFPIIFIKAASLTHSAHGDAAELRRDGLLYTAGVLATFLAVAGLLLALRAGGEQLGWGFHLQSPAVVALSAYTLFLVGLNLSGLFTVGERFAGSGEGLARRSGAAGAFFTGALAVVVAAPCIGPLLSAPMGAALLLPPVQGLLIFAVLALGLAAPFLALTVAPPLARLLPKPGAWMQIFKQLLAFPVFAAAAYFVWVFARQTGANAMGVVLAGAVALAFAAWGFEKSKGEGGVRLALRAASAIAVLLALFPLARIEPAGAAPDAGAYGAIETESYDADALAGYRAAGTPVFIDFTAAWCVTCQVNKMTVLKSSEVADAFARAGAVLMVADWTVRDPAITEALEAFGASGVPLYVYYGPSGEANFLPQALTKKAVISALSKGV